MELHTYRDKLKITGVYEKDGKTPKESHQYRVGSVGKIANLYIGMPLLFEYADGHGTLITSNVKDIEEDDYGVTIKTKNSVYVFDDVYEE